MSAFLLVKRSFRSTSVKRFSEAGRPLLRELHDMKLVED